MNWIQKITRPDVDDQALFGIVLKKSNRLTLIEEEYEFTMDGCKVIRNVDIAMCKPTPTTRYGTRLMKKEGLLPEPCATALPRISDWRNLFLSLRSMNEFVIVEDERNGDFLIGPIQRVNKKSVTIKHFDGAGKWTEPENIDYTDITCVTFRSRYTNIHRKHIKT